jgi:dGTPase
MSKQIQPAANAPSALLTVHEREALILAPYATFSVDSAGREHPEAEHPYRGPFQRDRDRVLHSSAYRRLSGKMQVFTGEMGDYHRTRLTHTQEVATIARTIGRTLRLNEDLIEALALVHDIGHPPYGHAGEDVLSECLAEEGGFSHNQYALTLVRELEKRFTSYPGLNLTREVLAGQTARVDKKRRAVPVSLEVQLVDAADSTTYDAHDTDDAIKLGLVTLDDMAEVDLIRDGLRHVRAQYAALDPDMLRKAVVHWLIEVQVTDLIDYCGRALQRLAIGSAAEAAARDFTIGPSPDLAQQKRALEDFLYGRVYRHPHLIFVRERAQQRLHKMFEGYVRRPELIPAKYQYRIGTAGIRRTVADYIAGMTDHYCEHMFATHFG